MTNLDRVLKGKDITLLTKIHIVKAMIFPVVMFRCERWTIKKAECQRINAFFFFFLELMLLNCGAGEDSRESFGQQGDQTSQS